MSVSAVNPAASQSPQQTLLDKLKKAAEEQKRKEDAKPKAKDGETLSPIGTLNVISGQWKPPKPASSSSDSSSDSSSSSSSGTNYDSIA